MGNGLTPAMTDSSTDKDGFRVGIAMGEFRRWWMVGVLACVAIGWVTPACADDKAALVERMHRADAESSLDVDGVKPWHLKMTVQLYDAKGQPTAEVGTIEEWWAGRHAHRIVYATPAYRMTEVENADGLFRTKDSDSAPLLLKALLDQVVHPMPKASDIDGSVPDLKKQNFGKVPLECIMLGQPIKGAGVVPLGLFSTYCFDPGADSLRVSYDFGSQLILRNAVGKFQTRNVATQVTIDEGNVKAASAKVETLEGSTEEAARLTDVADLVSAKDRITQMSGGVMAGLIVRKVAPIYPASAKEHGESGSVVMRAVIGRDGHIHSLRILSLSYPDLAVAALAAVRQWTYKPYLLNGDPTEVDTTITVNFNLSR